LKEHNRVNERYENLITGYSKNKAQLNQPLQHGLASALGYRICALRETFEESGVLIANDDKGKEMVLSNPNEHIGGEFSTLGEWRRNVYKDPSKFYEMFR